MVDNICTLVGIDTGYTPVLAEGFARAGYQIVLVDRRPGILASVKENLSRKDVPAYTYTADTLEFHSLSRAFNLIRAELGETDLLVYNTVADLYGMCEDGRGFLTNSMNQKGIIGALLVSQQVVNSMRARRSGTILLGDMSLNLEQDTLGSPQGIPGLQEFAESQERELSSYGIQVARITIPRAFAEGEYSQRDQVADKIRDLLIKRRARWQSDLVFAG